VSDREYYNYFRYYDPGTGRYITSDPIGLAGGLNTYSYVGNDPLYWIDPYGLYYAEIFGTGGAILGGTIAAGGSVILDAATVGFNIFATPAEIAAGIAIGGAAGYGLGSALDWALSENQCSADDEREKSKAKGIPDSQIGPSGKPKIHVKKHSSKKKAKDAASQDGNGPPMHHPSPTTGGPHYHPTDANGEKIPGGNHHEYP